MQRLIATTITIASTIVSGSYIAPTDIRRGCARFYLSNPLSTFRGMSEDGTQYWQICAQPEKDKPAKLAIGAGIFAKIKDKFGDDTSNSISFISTGPGTWIDIYSKLRQTGETFAITPLQDIDLTQVPLKLDVDHNSFNDNIMSAFIRSTDGDNSDPDSGDLPPNVVPIAVWYTFKQVKSVPADNGCGYFYNADPTVGLADGFAICFSDNQHLAHVNSHDMKLRGYTDALNGKPIVFVHAGPSTDIGVYEKDTYDGDKNIILAKDHQYIHHNVKSIILISTENAEQKTPAAMFASAERYLHGKGVLSDI